jgi:hypothetical protein
MVLNTGHNFEILECRGRRFSCYKREICGKGGCLNDKCANEGAVAASDLHDVEGC